MSTIDVSDLAHEELAPAKFPVDYHAPFRLFLAPDVHRGIQAHAKEDASVEICGVLVGRWGRDDLGPFAEVTDYIRCDSASSKFAEVTFTHESWAQINEQMDSKFIDKRIIGWYHSHPDFGIFLSDRDCFIHEHFFSGPGQVAYVVDPVRDLEGVFEWQGGKPTPMSHYWIGPQIRTVDASQRNVSREQGGRAAAMPSARAVEETPTVYASGGHSSFGSAATMLGWIGLFLLGYLLASMRSRGEQQTVMEGLLAHYGITKVMNIGLEQDLAVLRKNAQAISDAAQKLPQPTDKLSEAEAVAAAKQLKAVTDSLLLTQKMLELVEQRYTLSAEEQAIVSRLFQRQQQALLNAQPAQNSANKPAATGGTSSKAPPSSPPKIEASPPASSPPVTKPIDAASSSAQPTSANPPAPASADKPAESAK